MPRRQNPYNPLFIPMQWTANDVQITTRDISEIIPEYMYIYTFTG